VADRGLEIPRLTLGRNLTDTPPSLDVGNGIAGPLAAFGAAADAFGRGIGALADKAAKREGEAAALKDLQGGVAQPLPPGRMFNEAYNGAMKEARAASYKAEINGAFDKALIDNPEDEAGYLKATEAIMAGLGSSGFTDVDLNVRNYAEVQRQANLPKIHLARDKRRQETAIGAFQVAMQAEEQLLSQTIQTADFSPEGGQLVGAGLHRALNTLAKYGPKGEFEVGGVRFAADDTRLGVVGADDLARLSVGLQAQARSSWIVTAAERLPDASAKEAFLKDIEARRAANDPMLDGIDIAGFDTLRDKLEGVVARGEAAENRARTEAGQKARDLIEAIRWGEDVDDDVLIATAQASGDEGLIAQAKAYAHYGMRAGSFLAHQRRIGGGSGGGDDDGVPGGGWSPPASIVPGSPDFIAWENTRDGFATDPVKYVRGTKKRAAIEDVPALAPDGFAGEGRGAWGAAMQGRAALARTRAKTYAVPERMLTNAEVKYYTDRIEQDPAYATQLAAAALEALGPHGSVQLMKEIGLDARSGQAVHQGQLIAVGGGNLVASAQKGRELRSQGMKDFKYDGAGLDLDELQGEYAPAFRNNPQALATAMQVAKDAMLADRAAGISRPARYYLQGGLGATQRSGTVFGGVPVLNGKRTVVPFWLAQDQAGAALKALGGSWEKTGRGPVYSNGQPMKASEIARLRMEYLSNGNYQFINPANGAVVRGKDGRVFEIDMDKARPFLARVMPKAVKP